MALPENFSVPPKEEMHRHFRNACIEFKKVIQSTKDPVKLKQEADRFIHTATKVDWHPAKKDAYHKLESEKAVGKVWREYKRYMTELDSANSAAAAQDLMEALSEVERLIDNYKVR